MNIENVTLTLLPHQRQYLNACLSGKYTDILLCGGTGSGKSYVNALLALILTRKFRIPGLFYSSQWENLIQDIEQMQAVWSLLGIKARLYFSKTGENKGHRLELDGTHHHARSMERPESIVSFQAGWAIGGETGDGKEFSFTAVHQRIRAPLPEDIRNQITALGASTAGLYINAQATTPKGVSTWHGKNFLFHKKGFFLIQGVSSRDNPYTPESYRGWLDENIAGQMKEQEVNGKLVAFSGNCYKVKEMPYRYNPFLPWILAVDFGFNNPAFLYLQEFYPGKYCVFGGYAPQKTTLRDAASEIIRSWEHFYGTPWKPPIFGVGDPAGRSGNPIEYKTERDILEQLLKTTIYFNTNYPFCSVRSGVMMVASLFETGELFISSYLRKKERESDYISVYDAISGLQYKEGGANDDIDKTTNPDAIHYNDALRYGAVYLYREKFTKLYGKAA